MVIEIPRRQGLFVNERYAAQNMATTSFTAIQEGATSLSEFDLIGSARHGDLEAFNQLVRTYQDRIYNLAVRILGDEDTANDIAQDTFLTAYLNLPRFRNGSFRSWLYRIATNACYDVHRQHKRYPVLSIDKDDLVEEHLSPIDDFSSSSSLPEIEFERLEMARSIQRALDQLDVDQRTVVVLIDLQGCDYQEAARILRIPIGTVKSRLSRARMHLKILINYLPNN